MLFVDAVMYLSQYVEPASFFGEFTKLKSEPVNSFDSGSTGYSITICGPHWNIQEASQIASAHHFIILSTFQYIYDGSVYIESSRGQLHIKLGNLDHSYPCTSVNFLRSKNSLVD
jgi:hypothetical protein